MDQRPLQLSPEELAAVLVVHEQQMQVFKRTNVPAEQPDIQLPDACTVLVNESRRACSQKHQQLAKDEADKCANLTCTCQAAKYRSERRGVLTLDLA